MGAQPASETVDGWLELKLSWQSARQSTGIAVYLQMVANHECDLLSLGAGSCALKQITPRYATRVTRHHRRDPLLAWESHATRLTNTVTVGCLHSYNRARRVMHLVRASKFITYLACGSFWQR